MPDWRRIIVGDAFSLPSRDVNYYRDMLLAGPFVLSTIAALWKLLGPGQDHSLGVRLGVVSLACLVLARERFVLIVAAVGFTAVESGSSFLLRHDPVGLAISIPAWVVLVFLARYLRNRKPTYDIAPRGDMVGIVLGIVSLCLGIAILRWF